MAKLQPGKTHVDESGIRTRQGTTPGGRKYTATRFPKKNGLTGGGQVKIKSATTTWTKDRMHTGGETSKRRVIHEGHSVPGVSTTFNNVKGPTKPKAGYGKTHTFKDGGKLRQGVTPGGRQYKAVRFAGSDKLYGGPRETKVGGLVKRTTPGGTISKRSLTTGKRVEKGQTKPKGN